MTEDNLPVVPHHSQVKTEKASEVGLMLLVEANACMLSWETVVKVESVYKTNSFVCKIISDLLGYS